MLTVPPAPPTKEIGQMIKGIQQVTRDAVTSMEQGGKEAQEGTDRAAKSGEMLQQILSQMNNVAHQISQIATAAEQQTSTTCGISQNMQQISDVVQQTAKVPRNRRQLRIRWQSWPTS